MTQSSTLLEKVCNNMQHYYGNIATTFNNMELSSAEVAYFTKLKGEKQFYKHDRHQQKKQRNRQVKKSVYPTVISRRFECK